MEEPQLTFEEAFSRLEDAVGRLESGGLTIEDLVRNFEQGMLLVRLCNDQLTAAQLRISVLMRDAEGADGLTADELVARLEEDMS